MAQRGNHQKKQLKSSSIRSAETPVAVSIREIPADKEVESHHPVAGPVPKRILVVDIGGTKIKILASGETEPRKCRSGRTMTPGRMAEAVKKLAEGWEYQAVSLGYPGLVGNAGPRSEPGNLAAGWVGFDFAAAFGLPVRVLNDAAMQALGSYEGGRMLFLGLGTGIGSTLISENVIVTLELGQLWSGDGATISELLGRRGLKRIGKKSWREGVTRMVDVLSAAFTADYVVLGGGNAKEVKVLPTGARMGHNLTAFRGGFRLWNLEDIQTLCPDSNHECPPIAVPAEWRVL